MRRFGAHSHKRPLRSDAAKITPADSAERVLKGTLSGKRAIARYDAAVEIGWSVQREHTTTKRESSGGLRPFARIGQISAEIPVAPLSNRCPTVSDNPGPRVSAPEMSSSVPLPLALPLRLLLGPLGRRDPERISIVPVLVVETAMPL